MILVKEVHDFKTNTIVLLGKDSSLPGNLRDLKSYPSPKAALDDSEASFIVYFDKDGDLTTSWYKDRVFLSDLPNRYERKTFLSLFFKEEL